MDSFRGSRIAAAGFGVGVPVGPAAGAGPQESGSAADAGKGVEFAAGLCGTEEDGEGLGVVVSGVVHGFLPGWAPPRSGAGPGWLAAALAAALPVAAQDTGVVGGGGAGDGVAGEVDAVSVLVRDGGRLRPRPRGGYRSRPLVSRPALRLN